MESSFVSFVNKPFLLCVPIIVSGGFVLCCVYFLPFSASYHLPLVCAVVLCFFFFFLDCRYHYLELLTNVIFTWILIYWWYDVVSHWYKDIVGTCWPDVGCNIGYCTAGWIITGCHCALAFWYIWWVFMGSPDPGTSPSANLIFLLWYICAVCVPEVLRASGLEAG